MDEKMRLHARERPQRSSRPMYRESITLVFIKRTPHASAFDLINKCLYLSVMFPLTACTRILITGK